MDLNLLKKLLTSTEVLGVDAQPLRDFITAFQAKQVSGDEFKHLLMTLANIINAHKFAPNSHPVQVQMLLQQLKQAMEKKAASKASAPEAVPSDINMHLLNALLEIKSEVKNLKDGIPQSQVITQVIHQQAGEAEKHESPTLGPVFVNPLEDTKEIKGNVTIEAKTEGTGIANKLNRLKELKRGGS